MTATKKRRRHWKGLDLRIELKVDPVWDNRVRCRSAEKGVSISDYIRRAVEDQLARDEMYQSSRK